MRKMFQASLMMALAAISVAATARSAGPVAVPRHGQDIITGRCALCHGPDGESASAVYPRLAAQHPDYLQKQLRDFRDGRRVSDPMSEMAKDLKDDDIAALAAFFASKKAGGRQPGDVDLANVGKYIFNRGNGYSCVAACASCHGATGYGTEKLPRLAGQHPAYVETQLREFNKRVRNNDNAVMHTIAAKLTELEVNAVSAYLGGLE